MRVIELDKGQVALVGDAEFEELNRYKWKATQGRFHDFYVASREAVVDGETKTIYMNCQVCSMDYYRSSIIRSGNDVDYSDYEGSRNEY